LSAESVLVTTGYAGKAILDGRPDKEVQLVVKPFSFSQKQQRDTS
jgi:hypothetical protein